MLKILYLSSKRAKERDLLEAASGIEFQEVNLHLSSSTKKYLYSIMIFLKKIRKFSPDMVLLETPGLSMLPVVVVCAVFRRPYVVRIKGNIWETKKAGATASELSALKKIFRYCDFYAAQLFALPNASGILPISHDIHHALLENIRQDIQSYIVPIPYSMRMLRLSNQCNDKSTKKTISCSPSEVSTVLTVTNFNFWGKVKPLVEAIPLLAPSFHEMNTQWLIVGGGECLQYAREQLPEFTTMFVGQVDVEQLVQLYSNAQLLLYISGLDGLPNVLLEASLFKLPILINDDSPATAYLKDDSLGIKASLDNTEQFVQIISEVMGNSEWRQQLGNNVRQHVLENYSVNKVSNILEDSLQRIYTSI